MRNKTCGECKHHKEKCHCEKFGCYAGESDFCDEFEPKQKPTNGEKLWNSGYDAVIAFAKTWMEKFSCWAEAESWLNAPAESEGEDDTARD
jgi:hypothetical protein